MPPHWEDLRYDRMNAYLLRTISDADLPEIIANATHFDDIYLKLDLKLRAAWEAVLEWPARAKQSSCHIRNPGIELKFGCYV